MILIDFLLQCQIGSTENANRAEKKTSTNRYVVTLLNPPSAGFAAKEPSLALIYAFRSITAI